MKVVLDDDFSFCEVGGGGGGGGGKDRVRFHLSHKNFSDPSQSHQIFFDAPSPPPPDM